jgi:hypothetical protein
MWQYHPRSDRHSKIACWGILFDLLRESELIRRHATTGKIIFGINQTMSDFRTRRKKNLDIVIARPLSDQPASKRPPRTFESLAEHYGILLQKEQLAELSALPTLLEGKRVGSVLMALEAKACMTEHGKARPRLYDELNSSHLTIHGSSDQAIAVGFVMINASESFISPTNQSAQRTTNVARHNQPTVTVSVMQKMKEIPRRSKAMEEGFDALGIVIVVCANDGTEIELVSGPPAPPPTDDFSYGMMIRRIQHKYEVAFAGI